MLTYERRHEISFSVKWFGCRTAKGGVAFAHVTDSTIPNKCGPVQKIFVRSCNMSCDFFARFAIWSANTIQKYVSLPFQCFYNLYNKNK